MNSTLAIRRLILAGIFVVSLSFAGCAFAADAIKGQVLGGGAPIAGSTVTLWQASADVPKQISQTKTGDDGRFELRTAGGGSAVAARGRHSVVSTPIATTSDAIFYLVASGGESKAGRTGGDNPAIALMVVLGSKLPASLVIDEFTTVASVWTNAQFLNGAAIQGPALGLRIAAGNVANFADVETGGYGGPILGPLNSTQTPTMANFGTIATLLAGCITRVKADACSSLFAAATPPGGKVPTDTLGAAESIARNAAYKPERLFGLLDAFYPVPKGRTLRPTPFMPYLSVAPSAWVLPLKFTGGGLSGPGKVMFDSEGNEWSGANFIVGGQSRDALWDGNLIKFAPNGQPLSPSPNGFSGGGLEGPGFGTAIDANDNVWVTSTNGKTISLFDKNGKPLSPSLGYRLDGKLGKVQGVIVAPNGDVWALDFGGDRVIYMPKGDPSKVKFYCESTDGKPNKESPCKLNGPFFLAIDQQNRIWITNVIGDTVTRFPASDPSKVEVLPTGGHSGKGMAIDSKGNAWIANTAGDGLSLWTKLHLLWLKLDEKMDEADPIVLADLFSHPGLGSISMLRPDGTPGPGSPFNGGGSTWGTWAIAIDGNDQVWASNFGSPQITHLCGARTETCPPGMKTGDPISPPGGYVGGGMSPLTDIAIDPAGNVWVANNWGTPDSCYGKGGKSKSTLCGGDGLTVFYGMAKPVRAPQIGPSRAY
jgi:hypothetical protein